MLMIIIIIIVFKVNNTVGIKSYPQKKVTYYYNGICLENLNLYLFVNSLTQTSLCVYFENTSI